MYENRVLCSEQKKKTGYYALQWEIEHKRSRQLESLADEAPGSGVMVCRRSNGRGSCDRQRL
jgi:hypothetical protein